MASLLTDRKVPNAPIRRDLEALDAALEASFPVGTDDIEDDAVTAAKIAAGAVGTSEIATDGVGTAEIAADAVGASEIATGAVGSAEIATDAVGSDELAANAVSNIYFAEGTTSGPTTTSTADPFTAVLAQMTLTQDFSGDPILISFASAFTHSTTAFLRVALYDGTTEIGESRKSVAMTSTNQINISIPNYFYQPAAGSRTITVRWSTSTGTAAAVAAQRHLSILRLKA